MVGAVPAGVVVNACCERGSEVGGALRGRIEGDEQGLVFGVDQVIGARRADLADLGRATGRREGNGLGTAIDLKHHWMPASRQRSPQDGKRTDEKCVRDGLINRGDPLPPEAEAPAGRPVNRSRRAGDELDRAAIALFPCLPPRHETVLGEQNGLRSRVRFE